jgi:hypothetical protein
MSRYSAAFTTGAGSTTLPIGSVYAAAGSGFILREVGVFNTTTTAVVLGLKLVRLTSAGTQGAGVTANVFSGYSPAAAATAKQTHTGAPTLGADIAQMPAGAAIGAGTILTFYGETSGLVVLAGTANGIGILPLGTGQICTVTFIWDE